MTRPQLLLKVRCPLDVACALEVCMVREFPWLPWESHKMETWKAYTEFMEMGTGMGMVDKKWERNENSSLEEIPVSRSNHINR